MTGNGISGRCSWNTHCLLTRAALPPSRYDLSEGVPVVEIEEFLAVGDSRITDLAGRFRELVRLKSGAAGRSSAAFPQTLRSWSDLAAALGLNPKVELHYVRALRPEELSAGTAHDPSRDGPPGGLYVETTRLESMEARDILCTFADEPDWGMDQDLFPLEEYGYGSPPFGASTGKSSQAPFHMAFLHGLGVLRFLFPYLGRSFMSERVDVFLALSRLAFEKDVEYWGLRFAAWAMHYLQDLTQPYHAFPFPLSLWGTIRRIVRKRGPARISGKIGALLKNHHLFFEAAVHFLLNHAAKRREDGPFARALASGERGYGGPARLVMQVCSEIPAHLAKAVDQSTVSIFPILESIDEGTIPVDHAVAGIDEIVNRAKRENPVYFDRWTELICRCFTVTGDVTRYAAARAAGPHSVRESK